MLFIISSSPKVHFIGRWKRKIYMAWKRFHNYEQQRWILVANRPTTMAIKPLAAPLTITTRRWTKLWRLPVGWWGSLRRGFPLMPLKVLSSASVREVRNRRFWRAECALPHCMVGDEAPQNFFVCAPKILDKTPRFLYNILYDKGNKKVKALNRCGKMVGLNEKNPWLFVPFIV